MNLNSKIYIAGHTGLVGSSILRTLKSLGYKNLITADFSLLDLRRQKETEEFFAKNRPEYVFLAAAKVGGIWANDTYKAEFIYDNLMISTNIIHASYKFGVKKLINLGSSCIYPKNAPQPLKEEYLLSGYLESTNEAYAISKITAIKLCKFYNEQYKTNFISVMPTNLYGENDNFNLDTSHVLPALIRKIHLAKLLSNNDYYSIKQNLQKDFESEGLLVNELERYGIFKNRVVLWGTGNPYREFLHVNDLIEALIFLMKNIDVKNIGEIINIGTGIDLTISDLSLLLKEVIGFNGEIYFDSNKPDGVTKKLLDVSRIQKFGWKAKVGLKEGIKQVYSTYVYRQNVKNFVISKLEGFLKC